MSGKKSAKSDALKKAPIKLRDLASKKDPKGGLSNDPTKLGKGPNIGR